MVLVWMIPIPLQAQGVKTGEIRRKLSEQEDGQRESRN